MIRRNSPDVSNRPEVQSLYIAKGCQSLTPKYSATCVVKIELASGSFAWFSSINLGL
jgi:hypothetical protein